MQGILQVSHSCWKTLSGVGPFEAATSWNEKKMKRHLFSLKKMRWTSNWSFDFTHLTHDPVWKSDLQSTRIDRSTLAFVVSRCESAESAESKSGAPESIRQGVTHFPWTTWRFVEVEQLFNGPPTSWLEDYTFEGWKVNVFFFRCFRRNVACVARSYCMSFKWPKPYDFLWSL